MLILGIDPGSVTTGYAIVKIENASPFLIETDVIPIQSKDAPARLRELHAGLRNLIQSHKPAYMAIERVFFAKNAKTALAVSEARGVALLTGALAGLTVLEYTPLEVKKAITGDGRADKQQVKKMAELTLSSRLPEKKPDDAYDAVALALTCWFLERNRRE
ncbi:MAG: crossover junction endodeoxyribonuclease RuvC [Candidatus Sungbacteria bacterium]|nr:crossover junction endodeoxyribonuclease RuvC [Candidatus Sungbacteria bacterium]